MRGLSLYSSRLILLTDERIRGGEWADGFEKPLAGEQSFRVNGVVANGLRVSTKGSRTPVFTGGFKINWFMKKMADGIEQTGGERVTHPRLGGSWLARVRPMLLLFMRLA